MAAAAAAAPPFSPPPAANVFVSVLVSGAAPPLRAAAMSVRKAPGPKGFVSGETSRNGHDSSSDSPSTQKPPLAPPVSSMST
eukprot:scaffold33024_cov79-Isochrysis_galbana.AAC.1